MIRSLVAALLLLLALPGIAAELPREQLVLRSALSVDALANTVVLPLHRGVSRGQSVWYILTDSSDRADAEARGLVHAPLLARAGSVQAVKRQGDSLVFPAAPDFSPPRRYDGGFPPVAVRPGAVAAAAYSPFIRLDAAGPVLNAPIVATGDGPFDVAGHSNTADRVLAIDTLRRTVTLLLSHGFAEGRQVVYISTEASDPVAAVLERATLAPALGEGDADIGLLAFINGPGQGLDDLIRAGGITLEATPKTAAQLGSARNILTAFPAGRTASGYSPLWSVSLLVWPAAAAAAVQTGQADIYRLVSSKRLTGPAGQDVAPAGFTVNCPVIAWIDGPVP